MDLLLLKDIMARSPVCMDEHYSVADALERMESHQTSTAVVTTASGHITGLVTEQALRERVRYCDDPDARLCDARQTTVTPYHAARLQAIFDTTQQLIALLEPDGRIINLNRMASEYFNMTPADACGMNLADYEWWANDAVRQAKVRLSIQQARGGQYVRYRVVMPHSDPHDTIDFRLSPVFDAQGQVHMLVAEGRIITDEIRAQRRLKQSEMRYRSFITHTSEIVFSIEPEQPIPMADRVEQQIAQLLDARVVTANLAMAKRYHHTDPDDVLGMTIGQLHLESGCTDEQFLQNWIQAGYTFNGYITKAINAAGICTWYSNNLNAVIHNHALIRLWGTQTDITERILAEDALSHSEELKRGILNSINAEIAVINHSGNIISTNERWKAFASNHCPESNRVVLNHIGNHNYFDLLKRYSSHSDCVARQVYQGIQDVISGQIVHFTLEYNCDTEHNYRWFHLSVTPLPNKNMVVITNTNISDQKVSELALQESETHLQLALDAGGAGIWVWDIHRDKVFIDDRFARFFGVSHIQPLPLAQVLTGVHPHDYQRVADEFQTAIQEQDDYTGEFRVTGEERLRWVSARGHIERDQQQRATRFSGVVLDITERKLAEEKLKSEQDLHSQYLSTMQTLMVALDQHANIVMINRAACELLGYPQSWLMGKNWFETCLKLPDIQDETLPVFQQIMRGDIEPSQYFENHIVDRYGQRHLIAWHNAILRDANGKGTGVLSSGQDITEQRKMELIKRDNEKTLRVIFEQAGVGVALVDSASGRFLRINHKYCELLGYSEQELANGIHVWDIIHPDDIEQDRHQIQRLLDGEILHYAVEKRYIHRDGSIVWVNLTATPTWEDDGDPHHHIAVVQDITPRKESEQKLKQAESDWIQAMDQFDDAFYLVDMERHLIRANKAFYDMIDVAPESCIGRPIAQLVHPEKEQFPCPIDQALKEHREVTLTLEADNHSNPMKRPIEISLRLVHDSQQQPTGMLVAIRDLSRTRQIRERLRLAGIVFDNTTEGIMVTDAEARVLEINQAFTDILGYQRHEIIGQSPGILNSGRHDDAFYKQMWTSLEQTGQWRGEIWNRRQDGSILPEWQTITRVEDERGNLTQFVAVFSDISQIKQSQEELAYLAHHDPLTGLPNRLLLNERLEQAIHRAARHNSQFTLMFLDIDNFKHINDSLGHPVGDQLLQALAAILAEAIGEEDTVARVSGDEFVIILNQVKTPQEAAQAGHHLIEMLAHPCRLQDREIAVTTSLGLCIYPKDGNNTADLLRNADAAMYKAKDNGRNTISFYNKNMTQEAFDRVMLENDLRQAIQRQELFLVYQPQINLSTGRCIGAEVLLRWEHHKLGMISPARFIPIAEDSGLIQNIGEWVLQTACQQGRIWLDEGLDIGRLAINIAGPQLQRGNLVDMVEEILAQTGFPAEQLELEVTESYIMKQADQAIICLKELRQMGITLAIDDFGTGHSSLSYLTQLPIHKLKIDQSFVRDLPEDQQKMTITNTVIVMGKSLGLTVIAEGVETKQQAAFLHDRECHEVQGYLYSKPKPADDFKCYILNHMTTSV
ncbi:MAG: PAS domain S-box protein [Oceanobacter sp.]